MDESLDKKLVEDFPNLYADRNADMRVTAMCWGFPENGWHALIRGCSKKLEAEILKQPEDKRSWFKASQVKEKYGTLRFYMTSENEEMRKIISKAERASAKTCEICGEKGKVLSAHGSPYGWLKCLCDKHGEEFEYMETKDEA